MARKSSKVDDLSALECEFAAADLNEAAAIKIEGKPGFIPALTDGDFSQMANR